MYFQQAGKSTLALHSPSAFILCVSPRQDLAHSSGAPVLGIAAQRTPGDGGQWDTNYKPHAVLSCFSRVQSCNLMDCSPPCSSVHGNSPGKNTGVGCQALLQRSPNPGIKPTSPTM